MLHVRGRPHVLRAWEEDPRTQANFDAILASPTSSRPSEVLPSPWPDGVSPPGNGRRCVIYVDSPFRYMWGFVVFACVLYTATVMPYRLCFVEFNASTTQSVGWDVSQRIVDFMFIVDFLLQFLFTYINRSGLEVDSHRAIACRYFRTDFCIDAIAVLVPEMAVLLVGIGGEVTSGVHFTKLPRILRLSRLLQLSKLSRGTLMENWLGKTLRQLKGIGLLSYAAGLIIIVHLFACGWYLCASLHGDDSAETWLARRQVDTEGLTLVNADNVTQWLHAMHFVLTVFTTVGFGDIGAVTNSEIGYVLTLMIVGAVVNSMIVSSVIHTIMSMDPATADLKMKKLAIDEFAEHAKLDQSVSRKLRMWVSEKHQHSSGYDIDSMRRMLIDGGGIPRYLLGILPSALFHGQLVCNDFIAMCSKTSARSVVPPRLPMLVALQLSEHRFISGEVVYHAFEHAHSLYLVTKGTFAHVARPSPKGGVLAVDWIELSLFPATSTGRTSITGPDPTCQKMTLCPYELISARSYCGSVELFSNHGRHSTLRCETETGGVMLRLSKPGLMLLAQEFPHYASQWKAETKRRAWSQLQRFQRLTTCRCYAEFAATCIQRCVRHYQQQQQRQQQQAPRIDQEWCKSSDELGTGPSSGSDLFDLESEPLTAKPAGASQPRQSILAPTISQLKGETANVGLGRSSHHDAVDGCCEADDGMRNLRVAVHVQGEQLQAALDGIAKLLERSRGCMMVAC